MDSKLNSPGAQVPSIVEGIISRCENNPSAVCFVDRSGARKNSCGSFLSLARRTSGFLESEGVALHTNVAIVLPDEFEYLAVMFGIWMYGCTAVPMADDFPPVRKSFILSDCGVSAVIDSSALERIEASPEKKTVRAKNSDIGTIFYTSGSTGTPKGVMNDFLSISNVSVLDDVMEIMEDDRYGYGSPFYFSAVYTVFHFILKGACGCRIPHEVMTDGALLGGFCRDNGLTALFISPSLLAQVKIPSGVVRHVITGSERVANLSPDGYELYNVYGMTETAGISFAFKIDRSYPNTPVGRPVEGLEAAILDENLNPVACGDEGELCLRGHVTPGYFGDTRRTVELLRGGWLHTGDIFKQLPDGNYLYVNRKDWMCKINGQRVEPQEVAQVISLVGGIDDVAVKGFTQDDGRQYLVAYYTSASGVERDYIIGHISESIPAYMIPSFFVKLDKFPLNANGKKDIKSLRSPLEAGTDRDIALPENETQKVICDAFSLALGIQKVSIDDDFFAIGGDSIRVVKVQGLCRSLSLSAGDIYRYRTVRRIEAALSAAGNGLKAAGVLSYGQGGANRADGAADNQAAVKDYPLSQTQMGIYAGCMERAGEISYNNAFLYKFSAEIDLERFCGACRTALKAHPQLFASIFTDDEGNPRQKMLSTDGFTVEPEWMKDEEFDSLRSTLVRPFDILKDRLFRIRVIVTETSRYLFVDFHHIVFDGTSNSVFVADLEAAYRGEEVGMEPCTGFDVALDEQTLRKTDYLDECARWYRDTFSDVDSTTVPDPDRFSDRISFDAVEFSLGITPDNLAKAAEEYGVTENVVATSAFAYMLGCCSHTTKSAFATIYNGRKDLSVGRTISMMVKTLPVSCSWGESTSAAQLMGAVKEQLVGCMSHDLFSFAEVCAATSFDSRVIFTYQDDLLERSSLCGFPCSFESLLENATGEPLAVQLFRRNGFLWLRSEYRSNMFSKELVEALSHCYRNVFNSFIHVRPSTPLKDIRLLDDRTAGEVVDTGRGAFTGKDIDVSRTIVSLFRSQVSAQPDATAVVDEEGSVTYRELDVWSDNLASRLLGEGIGTEDFVALMMPRRREYVASYMAVFKSGGAYVPMDYEYPEDRLLYMISDSGAKVLMTTRDIYRMKPIEGDFKVMFVDSFAGGQVSGSSVSSVDSDGGSAAAAVDNSSPRNLAYMIYTSGTTGKPKGVMIEHHSLSNFVQWTAPLLEIGPGVRVAQHSSFSFDGSLIDLMPTLAFGGELYIIPSSLRKDPDGLYDYLNRNRIDGVMITTQLAMTMLSSYDLKLKYLLTGGEKLSGKYDTDVRIINAYGPTEFTVVSSYYELENGNTPDNIPIGRAVPGTISAVVDPLGHLVPRGVAGELVLVGEQLSRGYWNRPDTTAERFVPCPFVAGEKMYRTGDLVRWNEDGELLYLGRMDFQVKLRGFRIELGEIEATLSKYEGVRNAVVAIKEIAGVQHICGYYMSDDELNHDDIRSFMASSLTDYMVPTAFVRMESMPMTPNGKVDVKKLPVPHIMAAHIEPPSTKMERDLFDIASEVLKSEAFGVTTNLVSMGMTSLGAIRLSMLVKKRLGIHIPSSRMLETPTIREWIPLCGEGVGDTLEPYPFRDSYPLTENQTGVYIDWEQHRDSVQYNIPFVLRFENADAASVRNALENVAAAHPYILTRIENVDGNINQRRGEGFTVDEVTVDFDPDTDYFRSMVRPFDLLSDKLYRFCVVKAPSHTFLFCDIHHIIYDGGSTNIFLNELSSALRGETIDLERFTAYDYSLHCADWKSSDSFAEAEGYFDKLLKSTVSASLPSFGGTKSSGVGNASIMLDRKTVEECCRREGITENAFFLTVLTQVLHRLTREDNLSVTTVSNGRSLSAIERSFGMFVRTLPVVSRMEKKSVSDVLRSMHSQIVATVGRDLYPFTRMVERNGVRSNIMFVYQGGVIDADKLPFTQQTLPLDMVKMPLAVTAFPGESSERIDFEYDKSLYSDSDIALFADSFKSFAVNMSCAAPDDSIGSVSCVSPSMAESLVALGSGEKLNVDADTTFITLFKRQVALHPDDTAVVDEAGSLSYSELDRCSDILAQMLVEQIGVGVDDFVSLMLPRRKEFCVAYIACYKSGAAYVPMDSDYPNDRLLYMIEDSASRVLITTRELFARKSAEGDFNVERVIFMDDLICNSAPGTAYQKATPHTLAYMIYTSGTTGKPKGVMIEHRSLVNMISWWSEAEHIGYGDNIAHYPSFSFDASIMDLMTSPAFGATLHIISSSLRNDLAGMSRYFEENHIAGCVMPTQVGMAMVTTFDLKLRFMMVGGEKMAGNINTGTHLYNGYGPTEFTVCSSYYLVDPSNVPDNIPIGRPVPNSVSAIVDTCGQLVPRGVPGELVLLGPQLARGYWNREQTTSERFVDSPFIKGEKMYRTGDLARWNDDGDLMFMGRIDTQVKLRGFRIELGEIENVMAKFEGIASAVACVKEISGVQHLCGYYKADKDLDEAALRRHLSGVLTGYMVPDFLVRMEQFPLTPNGKVDVKKLPLPEAASAASASADTFEAPEGDIEVSIAAAFAQVLNIDAPFSRNSSFFAMGGTSLLVMRVMVKLSEAGLKVTYGDVFRYPTPRTLAAFLDGFALGSASSENHVQAYTQSSDEKTVSETAVPLIGEDGYDYSAINSVLKSNTIDNIGKISSLDSRKVGDVLLLGATGFLGVHILNELIKGDGKIYCVVRPMKGLTCEGRLKSLLMYYFDDTFSELFGQRLFVIEGDMTDDGVMEQLLRIKVDTVINCAANVKHFAAGDEISKINLHGAEQLIDYCLRTGSLLVHTSTHSVSGLNNADKVKTFCEKDLYIGQSLMTKYQISKFQAERAILEAVASRGLKAKIVRLGNLMPRYSDGEFQINFENNGFMSRMRAYHLIGCIAPSHLHSVIEFAPIDQTASAILTLARTPERFTVFHPYNNHNIYTDDIVAIMRSSGLNIDVVDEDVFSQRLNETLQNEHLSPYITTLLAYGNHNDQIVNPACNDFTVSVLNDMDWRWPITGASYLEDIFDKLITLDYFNR